MFNRSDEEIVKFFFERKKESDEFMEQFIKKIEDWHKETCSNTTNPDKCAQAFSKIFIQLLWDSSEDVTVIDLRLN